LNGGSTIEQREIKLRSIRFEILMLMNDGHILTTGWSIGAVAWRVFSFLSTSLSFMKQCHILHPSTTTVDAHHKTGAGNQHQKGERERKY
jgi:hypothetical protein